MDNNKPKEELPSVPAHNRVNVFISHNNGEDTTRRIIVTIGKMLIKEIPAVVFDKHQTKKLY